MKIAYIDAKINHPPEDYALNPKRYGGGAVFARFAKQSLNTGGDTFHLFASKDCFDNLSSQDRADVCYAIDDGVLNELRLGRPLSTVIPDDYDLYIHHHDCFAFNMAGISAPLVHWALMGDGRANHPATPYSLLYLRQEQAVYGKTFHVQLGKNVPAYQAYEKSDYIFQCTRHDATTNSIPVVKWCNANAVKGLFAGPIFNGYNLLDFIDNKNTFYLGMISDADKHDYYKKARLATYDFLWDPPFNQSVIESMSYGTPSFCARRGFFKEIIREGVNGFFSDNCDLATAYSKATKINQESCHASVAHFNVDNMIQSFYTAFQQINHERSHHSIRTLL